MKVRKWGLGRVLTGAVLSLVAAALLFPIVFTLFYSFFPKSEMQAYLGLRDNYEATRFLPLLISPKQASLRQYYALLIEDPQYLQLFLNSVGYAAAILAGQALIVPATAYALSCFRFKGREGLFFGILILMLMPFQVTMTPTLITLRTLKLIDTPWAVVLPMWFAPFYIFLVRQFMVSVPEELLEAASIDGAGKLRGYMYVMLPVSRPILGAAAALSFADSWNMVEQPLNFLTRTHMQPLSVMLNQIGETQRDVAFAGAALYILPALFLYLYFQEDIQMGVALSELK